MKFLMMIATLVLSAQALACPNLTGNYTCNFAGEMEYIDITQQQAHGMTVYFINEDGFAADGKWRDMNDPESPGAKVMLECKGETLEMSVISNLYDKDNKTVVGDYSFKSEIALSNSGLDIKQTGFINSNGQAYPIDHTAACTKN